MLIPTRLDQVKLLSLIATITLCFCSCKHLPPPHPPPPQKKKKTLPLSITPGHHVTSIFENLGRFQINTRLSGFKFPYQSDITLNSLLKPKQHAWIYPKHITQQANNRTLLTFVDFEKPNFWHGIHTEGRLALRS